ncbi:MAG: Fe-S-containing hydro-lyase [Peptostreptococcaceae bacterium]|nr:Fe-S-containing hydro-lyase [Peptostreptococcaceae bacterium]
MNPIKKIEMPLTYKKVKELRAGDMVEITGVIYTGRDAAHKRLCDTLANGGNMPFDLTDSVIYYVGPAPAKPGNVIGSAGPTTSYRMDDLTVPLLESGLRGMIGKGVRSGEVIEAMIRTGAVYFAAIGGAGALISDTIKEAEVIAYGDLGTEAVRRLRVEKFPATVVIDSYGNNIYETEREKYRR